MSFVCVLPHLLCHDDDDNNDDDADDDEFRGLGGEPSLHTIVTAQAIFLKCMDCLQLGRREYLPNDSTPSLAFIVDSQSCIYALDLHYRTEARWSQPPL